MPPPTTAGTVIVQVPLFHFLLAPSQSRDTSLTRPIPQIGHLITIVTSPLSCHAPSITGMTRFRVPTRLIPTVHMVSHAWTIVVLTTTLAGSTTPTIMMAATGSTFPTQSHGTTSTPSTERLAQCASTTLRHRPTTMSPRTSTSSTWLSMPTTRMEHS